MGGKKEELPQIGRPLPNADRAIVPAEKLAKYCLNPESVKGRDKARVFRAALGITQADWRYLRGQILRALPSAPVSARQASPWVTWEVDLWVVGLNGKRKRVRTAWWLDEGTPRLVTAYVR